MTATVDAHTSPPSEGASGFRVVGQSIPRSDALQKVTGKAAYTGDLRLTNVAHAKVLRSPYAHARIRSIDATAALARPGVIAVVTGADLDGLPMPTYGPGIKDHWILAKGKARFAGEPVAVAIAEDELTAEEALDQIQVDYEELPAVMTAAEALAEGAPLVHEQSYGLGGMFPDPEDLRRNKGLTNICQENHFRWGDLEAAFARADVVVEGDYVFPMLYPYAMEPYTAIGDFRPEGLTVYSCAQHPYQVRRDVADVFGLPINQVRIVSAFIGGGYGSKSFTKIEPLVGLCSMKVGRPVRLELTIDESMLTSRADDSRIHLRTAATRDGKLLARQAIIRMNTGAYAESSPSINAKTGVRVFGPYVYEAADSAAYAVYTNTCPASSYRGFASNQVTLAAEVQMDELAEKLGMDPIKLRWRNVAEQGQRFFPGKRGMTADLKGDLRKLADGLDWDQPLPPNHGRGVGLVALDAGAAPVARSEVKVHGDGSLTVLSGATELGQGSRTVLAQIAAEELGVPFEKVRVIQSDTALTPFSYSTGAERTTTLEGRALIYACGDARQQLREMASELWEADPEDVQLEPGGAVSEGRRMPWSEIIGKYFRMMDMEVTGRGHVRLAGDVKEMPPFWAPSLAGVEVEVEPDTGRVRIVKLATVSEAGLVIHPAMVHGQELGGAVQGLGQALFEEMIYEGQQLANGSLLEYRVPRFSDVPEDVEIVAVELRDGIGPYGAKGIGEGPISSMCAAVSNAIFQAVGIRLRQAPFTPERVWQALQEQRQAAP